MIIMYGYIVCFYVYGYIIVMKKIVCESLFDHISFISETYDELIKSLMCISFHNMSKNWLSSDFHHWLGFDGCFLW